MARAVIGAAVVGGTAVLAYALTHRSPSGSTVAVVVFAAFVTATWVWPLMIYRNAQSEAIHLDEGLFIIMVLTLPTAGVILGYTAATVVAQAVRRRSPLKSVFNVGQILTAVGLGLVVSHAIAPPSPRLTPVEVLAAIAGTTIFFVVNTVALAGIVTATGSERFRPALTDGIEINLLLFGACVVLGIGTALAYSSYHWLLVFTGLPFWVLRQVLVGHFRARHDRERLDGLFQATLDANRSISADEVEGALRGAAQELLRCPEARLVDEAPSEETFNASLEVAGQTRWLVVDGRRKAEPFDSADASLLEALAAVGAGALTNAALYEEGRRQREHLATITSSLGEGVCAFDLDGRITMVNPTGEAMLGWPQDDLVNGEPEPVGAADALEILSRLALRAMRTRSTVRVEDTTLRRRDGSMFPVAFTCSPVLADGEVSGAVVVCHDITERKAFEEQLAHHAFHDALTGLPNRRVLLDRLDHALQTGGRRNQTHAVLFADVDRFKLVNDSIGHQAGDRLLIAIAERLRAVLRPGDSLARFGGDEFAVLLEDIGDVGYAEVVATRMLEALREPIALPEGHEVVASISLGIAVTTGNPSADDALHDADVAMYQAKSRGPGRYVVYDAAAMGARSDERLQLEADLRRAMERDEIEIFFQPLVATASERVVGVEALVRWNHPSRGVLPPAEFIPLAQETGLILPLGQIVLEQACRSARTWRDTLDISLEMSVNLSPRQFGHRGLVQEIAGIIARNGIESRQLCLEITETLAVADVKRTIGLLEDLRALGVRMAIDDFGTGYSSLTYLKQFPVDVVKIDRSFVEGIDQSEVDLAIVTAVLGLANAVGMVTVAEGVETVEQLERLRQLGCPVVQGFYLSPPLRHDELTALLIEQSSGGHRVGIHA